MLGGRILHGDQPLGGRDLLCVKKDWVSLVVVLILEGLEKFMGGFLGAADLFHLLPDLFDVQIHDISLVRVAHIGCVLERVLNTR